MTREMDQAGSAYFSQVVFVLWEAGLDGIHSFLTILGGGWVGWVIGVGVSGLTWFVGPGGEAMGYGPIFGFELGLRGACADR